MAYQTRGRDPLLDSTMQAAIEKRGKELIGLALLGLALMAALMLGTYSPEDPNWMLASDAPVQNWMGTFGASIAHPLLMVMGRGAWLIPLILMAWGLRFTGHWGEERALGRVVFAPIAVAVAAIYAATLVPGDTDGHSYGLGGIFGYTALSIVLTILPVGLGIGAKLVSLVAGLTAMVLLAWALGFTNRELRLGLRWVLYGLILAYDMILRTLGRGAALSVSAARGTAGTLAERAADRRAAAVESRARLAEEVWEEDEVPPAPRLRATRAEVRPEPAVAARAEPPVQARIEPPVQQRAAPILRAGDARLMPPMTAAEVPPPAPRRAVAPPMQTLVAPVRSPARDETPAPARSFLSGLFHRAEPQPEVPAEEPGTEDDRLRARISDAIRARSAPPPAPVEPRKVHPKGPIPLILDTTRRPAPKAEPPVTARALPPAPEDEPLYDEDFADDGFPEPELVDGPAPEPRFEPIHRALAAQPRKAVVEHAAPPAPKSSRARAEAQPKLPLEDRYADYETPPLHLLADPAEVQRHHLSDEALEENARMLESVLDDYGVKGEIVSVRPGPVVTMYELEPAPGLKASRVIGLADDIARSMSALSARVSTVPGRSVIGIELPNEKREKVVLREILSARDFGDGQAKLPLALGKDIGGGPVVANLAKMPHLLIAGTTGSGKSVAINTMILSLLYKLTPEECRLIMIDPKMLELSVYDGIPHLLSPVVTDPKKAVVALKWVVGEMEDRYRKMSKMGVRNIDGYNGRVKDALAKGETFDRTVQTGFDEETGDPIFETEEITPEAMPYIVVIVDEMADLMMVAGKEIEACIQRLAQMARASGIHLIMATQRPSVDVITGTIKANFPTRISFQVTSKIDSRTILGEQGAEQLLGMGDMLYMAGGGKISRVHGPFCSDEEVEEIVNFLKGFGPPSYVSSVLEGPAEDASSDIDAVLGLGSGAEGDEALYDMAVQIAAKDRKCSTSYIQRKLAIGYNKAARLVEQMEEQGVVSSANHVGKREVLVPEPH